MEKDLVSIIVPIYNVEKYIEKCIISLINQTYKEIEIILVIDGSPDSSIEICRKYKEIDKRIKIINKKNGGLSDARNVGFENSNGNFILFVDGDDFIADDMVEFLLNQIKDYNSDISSCGFYMYYPQNNKPKENENDSNNKVFEMSREQALEMMLKKEYTFGWGAWNKLYKRELFKKVRYPYGKIYEDVGTTYKLILNSQKITYCAIPKYYYVQNNNSITKTFAFNEKEVNRIEMCEQMVNEIWLKTDNKKLNHELNQFRISQYISVCNVMIKSDTYCKKIIKKTQKLAFKYFIDIIKYSSLKLKMQAMIIMISFKLYKKLYLKNIKEG